METVSINNDVDRVRRLIATLQRMQTRERSRERAAQIKQLQQALASHTGTFRERRGKVSRRMKRQPKPRA